MKGIKQRVTPRQGIGLFLVFFTCLSIIMGSISPLTSQAADEKETYTIVSTEQYAPFGYINGDGDLVGMEVDILDAISKSQGITFEKKTMPFSSGLQALEADQVDGMIAGMGITPERQQSFDFSDPYYESGSIYAARKGEGIQSLEDLKGKRVAVKIGSLGSDLAKEMADDYGFRIAEFEESVNMYQDVATGNSDAVIEDYPVIMFAINTGTVDLEAVGDEIDKIPFGFAVNKGKNQELLNKFNAGLAELKESGELDKIIAKYTSDQAQTEEVDTSFMGQLTQNWGALLSGLGTTLLITILSVLLALVLGTLLGLMRTSKNAFLAGFARAYITLMRGVPLLVLAFFFYFGLPQLLGITIDAHIAGVATLGLNSAAYIAEIVRGGIDAIAKGQFEAGRSLGLSSKTTMKKIILPQSFKIMVPSLLNQFIITLKDTSILSVIGLVELTQTGRVIIARTYQSGSMWLIVGIIYLIIITVLTKVSDYLEKELI